MTRSDADYRKMEDWLAKQLEDADFDQAIRRYRDEDGDINRQGVMEGIRDAFETLRRKEERRLETRGEEGNTANSITAYFDEVIEGGRWSGNSDLRDLLRKTQVEDVIFKGTKGMVSIKEIVDDRYDIESERRRERSRQQFIKTTLDTATSAQEALRTLEESGQLNEDEMAVIRNSDKIIKLLTSKTENLEQDVQQLSESGLLSEDEIDALRERVGSQLEAQREREQREAESIENENARDVIRRIYAATEPGTLNSAFKREIERTFKTPGTRTRVLNAYFDRKLEIAPSRLQLPTKEQAERLRAIPEGISGATREKVITDNAEQILLQNVDSVYGKTLKTPVSIYGVDEPISTTQGLAERLTIKSMTALGLSNEEARLLRQRYKSERKAEEKANKSRSEKMTARHAGILPEEGEET